MSISAYKKYIYSLVQHGDRRIIEINWLFDSIDSSIQRAHSNFKKQKRARAYISLRHAKNLNGFLKRSLGDIPDQRLVKHLEEFFAYVDQALDECMRIPITEDLEEMRLLLKELHKGWLHLVSPIRGSLETVKTMAAKQAN